MRPASKTDAFTRRHRYNGRVARFFRLTLSTFILGIVGTASAASSWDPLAEQVIWQDGKAEWLTYALEFPAHGYTWEGQALIVTRGKELKKPQAAFAMHWQRQAAGNKGALTQQCDFEWNVPLNRLEKAGGFRGVLPDAVSGWQLSIRESQYVLESLGGAAKSITLKSPLVMEASVFLEARHWPLSPGWVKEIWWYPLQGKEQMPEASVYARIQVVGKEENVQDLKAWHVKIQPSEGRPCELWVQATGSRAILKAILSDGSTWTLLQVKRQ